MHTRQAPECFDTTLGKLTEKVDIFSLGVILWELVTRRVPWEGLEVGGTYPCLCARVA